MYNIAIYIYKIKTKHPAKDRCSSGRVLVLLQKAVCSHTKISLIKLTIESYAEVGSSSY